jgi:hypothetical protein
MERRESQCCRVTDSVHGLDIGLSLSGGVGMAHDGSNNVDTCTNGG